MVLAIVSAEPTNVRDGGRVESVVTPRTHFRFGDRRFAEVAGIGHARGCADSKLRAACANTTALASVNISAAAPCLHSA
jgi:hypothetical protein